MLKYFYIALLVLEGAVIAYDGTLNDTSLRTWLRFLVLGAGIVAYYCWVTNRVTFAPRWLWQAVGVAVLTWFLIFLPWQTWVGYTEMKQDPKFDVMLMVPGYIFYYILHVPMLIAAYSCGFKRRKDGNVSALAL